MDSQKILAHSFLMASEGLLRELSKTKPKKVVTFKVKHVGKGKPTWKDSTEDVVEESVVIEKPIIEEDMTHFNDHFETLIENAALREGLVSLSKALKKEKKLFNEQLKHSQSKLTEKIRLLEDDKKRLIQEQEELKATAETEQTETDKLALTMQCHAGLDPYTNAEKQEISKDE